jgi:hypothetical protein
MYEIHEGAVNTGFAFTYKNAWVPASAGDVPRWVDDEPGMTALLGLSVQV